MPGQAGPGRPKAARAGEPGQPLSPGPGSTLDDGDDRHDEQNNWNHVAPPGETCFQRRNDITGDPFPATTAPFFNRRSFLLPTLSTAASRNRLGTYSRGTIGRRGAGGARETYRVALATRLESRRNAEKRWGSPGRPQAARTGLPG